MDLHTDLSETDLHDRRREREYRKVLQCNRIYELMNIIENVRKQKNLSKQDIADRAGISISTYKRYTNDGFNQTLSVINLLNILQVLGFDTFDILQSFDD